MSQKPTKPLTLDSLLRYVRGASRSIDSPSEVITNICNFELDLTVSPPTFKFQTTDLDKECPSSKTTE